MTSKIQCREDKEGWWYLAGYIFGMPAWAGPFPFFTDMLMHFKVYATKDGNNNG